MIDIAGITAITITSFLTLLIALKWNDISKVIFIALAIRIVFLIINNNFFYLPDGDMDALNFEEKAWNMSREGFLNIFNFYKGPDPYFISVMLAIPYSILGRSILMAQSLSILFGVGSVFLGWLVAKKLWNNEAAIKVAWTIALFPSVISYSVLTMREVYISFFFLLAIYGIICWGKDKSYKSIFITFLGFVGASFFHGALSVGLIVFILLISLHSFYKSLKLIKAKIISIKQILLIILSSFIIFLYVTDKIHIPYLKNFSSSLDSNRLKILMIPNTKGDATYPQWLKVNHNVEFLYKIPIRTLYFLFSPFPWDVKKLSHLVGVIDGFLYIVLVYLIFLNRKAIWKNPALRIILLILICYFIVFGIGTTNFGTGLRHRVKFVFGLILLAGPLIPSLNFSNKNKIK